MYLPFYVGDTDGPDILRSLCIAIFRHLLELFDLAVFRGELGVHADLTRNFGEPRSHQIESSLFRLR